MALQSLPFINDKEIVMAERFGMALKYAPAFQDDSEVVMAAVKKDPNALEFVSEMQYDIALSVRKGQSEFMKNIIHLLNEYPMAKSY